MISILFSLRINWVIFQSSLWMVRIYSLSYPISKLNQNLTSLASSTPRQANILLTLHIHSLFVCLFWVGHPLQCFRVALSGVWWFLVEGIDHAVLWSKARVHTCQALWVISPTPFQEHFNGNWPSTLFPLCPSLPKTAPHPLKPKLWQGISLDSSAHPTSPQTDKSSVAMAPLTSSVLLSLGGCFWDVVLLFSVPITL